MHSKRRRKFKRMAIAPGLDVRDVRGATATKRKKVRSRSGLDGRTNTRLSSASSSCTPGKRKRSTREKWRVATSWAASGPGREPSV